jgi:hypothetical protein
MPRYHVHSGSLNDVFEADDVDQAFVAGFRAFMAMPDGSMLGRIMLADIEGGSKHGGWVVLTEVVAEMAGVALVKGGA